MQEEEFKFEKVEMEEKHGRFFASGYYRSIPDRFFFSGAFTKMAQEIRALEVYPDDTWVLTFPKCGTTWTQEMVWLINNDLDFARAKQISLFERFPFMEASTIAPDFMECLTDREANINETIECVKNMPRPRFIKSHLPAKFLPAKIWTIKPKTVYVAREVKDVIVSYYHHNRIFDGYNADLETFCKSFLKDEIHYCPFWSHISEFWRRRNELNLLWINYEDMQKDLPKAVRKVAHFFSKTFSDEQVQLLCHHLSFKEMKANSSVNSDGVIEILNSKSISKDANGRFIRKGKSGSWKDEISEELAKEIDKWSMDQLRGTDYLNDVFKK